MNFRGIFNLCETLGVQKVLLNAIVTAKKLNALFCFYDRFHVNVGIMFTVMQTLTW